MKHRLIFLIIGVVLLGLVGSGFAAEQKKIKWRMISTFAKSNQYLVYGPLYFVEQVKKMSGGDLDIEFYGVGELGTATDVFDKVSNGTFEAGSDSPLYWAGKNWAFDPVSCGIVGMNPVDYQLWLYGKSDGLKFLQELYGKYNMISFPIHMTMIESGIRSNKPIRKLTDLKGMKLRMGGYFQGKMINHYGGVVVNLGIHEIPEAIQRGTIDGAEWGPPYLDRLLKVDELTKYWCTPGWNTTGGYTSICINKNAWNSLPDHLKAIVETATKAANMQATCWAGSQEGEATKYFKDKGTVITKLSDQDIDELEKLKVQLVEELAAKNPDFARVIKSQNDYMRNTAHYREVSAPFGFGRSPKVYPNIP